MSNLNLFWEKCKKKERVAREELLFRKHYRSGHPPVLQRPYLM
jgi:hypothetical protein